ncbi:hypothetical protein NPX13_g7693 [Xylaria arbuscula]|uniref:Chromo domain-containing protein n=1 Tax=Xylaria arbuscula TaxID=114810 RepID=A0A9W8N9V0_9PEZI|nr:hypothetical protein NPX13_g7693 [Xylaria arbuscula]
MNEAILKQLQGGSERDSESPSAEDSGELDMLDNENAFSLEAFLPGPSSRGYAEFLIPNPPFPDPSEPSRSVSPNPLRRLPTYPKPTLRKMPPVSAEKTITPLPVPSYPSPRLKSPKPKHIPTCTPIPMPCYPIPKSKKPHEVTYTPVPPPVLPTTFNSPAVPSANNSTETHVPEIVRNGFTPAGRSHQKWSTTVNTGPEDELTDLPLTPSKMATPATKPNSSVKRKPPQPEEDQEWEVKRLEGDKVLETGGELVRFFRVRWSGSWPADQNPTWEPEENISPILVRKYLKDKAMKTAQEESSTGQINKLESAATVKKKYSSVAEAFEGDMNESSNFFVDPQPRDEDNVNDAGELFQVTEQPKITRPMNKLRADAALLQELAGSFLMD